jgi:hypothetical protein
MCPWRTWTLLSRTKSSSHHHRHHPQSRSRWRLSSCHPFPCLVGVWGVLALKPGFHDSYRDDKIFRMEAWPPEGGRAWSEGVTFDHQGTDAERKGLWRLLTWLDPEAQRGQRVLSDLTSVFRTAAARCAIRKSNHNSIFTDIRRFLTLAPFGQVFLPMCCLVAVMGYSRPCQIPTQSCCTHMNTSPPINKSDWTTALPQTPPRSFSLTWNLACRPRVL